MPCVLGLYWPCILLVLPLVSKPCPTSPHVPSMPPGNPKKQRMAHPFCLFERLFQLPFCLNHCVKLGALSLLLHKCLSDCFCELFWDLFWCLAVLLSLVAIACMSNHISAYSFRSPFLSVNLCSDRPSYTHGSIVIHAIHFLICRSCIEALTKHLQNTKCKYPCIFTDKRLGVFKDATLIRGLMIVTAVIGGCVCKIVHKMLPILSQGMLRYPQPAAVLEAKVTMPR